jgi:transcriptional antiterminator RfaH
MESWFAVATKPRSEAIAEENLRRQGYECLWPRVARLLRGAGGMKQRVESLFPSYVFLRADPAQVSLAPVRSTKGARGLVRFGGEPAAVPDTAIERIRARMDSLDGLVRLCMPELVAGQALRITEGPLCGWDAVFLAREGSDRVRLLLELLGSSREVVLPAQQLGLAV